MPGILTLTANPTLDLHWEVARLSVSGKNRARVAGAIAGGGGINVARALRSFGARAAAVASDSGTARFDPATAESPSGGVRARRRE